jgi:hypothetical protein
LESPFAIDGVILYRATAEDQTVHRRTGIVDRIAGRSVRGSLADDRWRIVRGNWFVLLSQVGAVHAFGAAGASFFGLVYDAAASYMAAFVAFVLALGFSAIMSVAVRPPQKIQPSKLGGRKQPGSC